LGPTPTGNEGWEQIVGGTVESAVLGGAGAALGGDKFEKGNDVATEVYKWTPFGKRFIDIEVSKNGQVLGGVEAKFGNSPYTWKQDWWLKDAQGYKVNVIRGK
jgi:hypothetical protein